MLIELNPAQLPEPPAQLIEYVARRQGEEGHGDERRAHPRYAMSVPVTVIPLGPGFKPTGEPFQGVTRDISVKSVALLHTKRMDEDSFVVHFKGPDEQPSIFLAQTIRCRQ